MCQKFFKCIPKKRTCHDVMKTVSFDVFLLVCLDHVSTSHK